MLFLLIKWVHVLSAIAAVGANITYAIWIVRASREPSVLPFTLRTIKLIDDRVANPLYALLLLTGLTMAFMVPIPLTTPWLATALVLYAITTLLGLVAFVPVFRRQIDLLDSEGFESPKYQAVARQARVLGIVVGVIVVAITYLMVVKPPLWG
ncbi:MAG TPA: DUF2269 family protein [Anaerolineales bacterium]|nr:DUF2269 family protein [Anaerolineales bacterium]